MKKFIIFTLLAFDLSLGISFAQNREFENLLREYEALANEFTSLANKIAANPDRDYERQIANLENRVNNAQSKLVSWQITMGKSSSEMPSDRQMDRFLDATDKIQQAGLKISNLYR